MSNQCCKNLELQWNCCASKEQSSTHCKYLSIKPGLNSFSEAVIVAKEQGIGRLFLECGVYDEKGERVVIDFPLKVVGQDKDDVRIRAGLRIEGKKEEDVFLSDCTVTGAKKSGVYGDSAAMHLKNVRVEKCGEHGVKVYSTKRNTMTDCNVNNNKWSGVFVYRGGRMLIDGSATTIHHNGTSGKGFNSYGLYAWCSSSSIHLKSPLTKESIATNNGGAGNYEDNGRIKTI